MVLVRGVEGVRARGIRCGQLIGDTEGEQGKSGRLEPAILLAVWSLCTPSQQVDNPFPPPAKVQAMSSKGLSLGCSPSPPPTESSLQPGIGMGGC